MEEKQKKEVIIIGARMDGHAGVIVNTIKTLDKYKLIGFFDNTPELQGTHVFGLPVIGSSDDLRKHDFAGKCVHIAIGDNVARSNLFKSLKKANIEVVTIIHPTAMISSDVTIEEGCFIAPGVIINNGSTISSVCIINSGAIIEHDNKIGHAVHVAPGATTAGRVIINDYAFIGVGSTILPDIEIGKGALVGAGSTVVRNVAPQITVMGYAAQKRKKNIYVSTQSLKNTNSIR